MAETRGPHYITNASKSREPALLETVYRCESRHDFTDCPIEFSPFLMYNVANGKPNSVWRCFMHTIITIGREYGSGGREIGELVADKLNIPF